MGGADDAAAATQASGDSHNMIALYYCYPPGSIPAHQLQSHAAFHEDTCLSLDLGGRIRVSKEGINGVLSGTEEHLREYEARLRRELMSVVPNNEIAASSNVENDPTAEWLDVKYCHLRKDIPTETQLFDSLSVKITREVVSLIEPSNGNGGKKKGRARCRQRRKQKRKEKQRLEKQREEDVGGDAEGCKGSGTNTIKVDQSANGEDFGSDALSPQNESTDAQPLGTALPIPDWEKKTPAVHLSPDEWNQKLLQLSRASGNDSSGSVLLDTRNVYETRVGHFGVPNLDTFFPNTRKFSSLPNALNTEEAAEALAGKEVFMYCTGGVRCERAGSYLRAISESNSGAWNGKEPPKGVYQLNGGIQKYLESYGKDQSSAEGKESIQEKGQTDEPCLYRGKNFVFDPRRTDPVVGNGVANAEGSVVSLVGRCIVCSTPHDDYDNGHAPCEEKEARCCRCRVLVLVCNECRQKVRCWGEPESNECEMELFCGKGGTECVDEGNIAAKVETARF
ncbi:hypothetical protein ACHAXT_001925 [Thalassiosira profunda]